MRKLNYLVLLLCCFLLSVFVVFLRDGAIAKSSVKYQTIERELYSLHIVTVPANGKYLISPQISGELQEITNFIDSNTTVAAINGGYFDPVNHKTTSFVIQNSHIEGDPRFNSRLMDNPDLELYLAKILNRSEFRRYKCGLDTRYDIRLHSASIPEGCNLIDAIGGGPGLLPINTSAKEGFTDYRDGQIIRDAIGNESLNARSAIAITDQGAVVLVIAQQKSGVSSGISVPKLAKVLQELGAVKAMNLDGGSSSSLYFDGRVVYGKVDVDGNTVRRPIKSILSVTSK